MDILLCGALDPDERRAWLMALTSALPEARWLDLPAARADPARVEAAVVANPEPGSLQGFPRLRVIQSLWAGVDRLVADPTLPPVPLARMVDPAMNAAMAETALWATLSLHRGFFEYAALQRAGQWKSLSQRRADEVRVAVLGLGQMGSAAALALARVGYRVTGWSLSPRSAGPAGVTAVHGPEALWALLPVTDIAINLLPLTAATRGLLDARCFAALPRGSAVVNLARGAHLVEADLLAALDSGALRHAVLDVFQQEPLPAGHRFWTHPSVTVLPHSAAITDERSAAQVVATNLRALAEGRPLAHLVDRGRGY